MIVEGLVLQVQNESKCGCEFNQIHIVWIVALCLLLLAAIVFGFIRWRRTQAPKDAPLLQHDSQANEISEEEVSEVTTM